MQNYQTLRLTKNGNLQKYKNCIRRSLSNFWERIMPDPPGRCLRAWGHLANMQHNEAGTAYMVHRDHRPLRVLVLDSISHRKSYSDLSCPGSLCESKRLDQ